MVFDASLSAATPLPNSRAAEHNGSTRVALSLVDPGDYYVYFTSETGWVLDAYRGSRSVPSCLVTSGSFWKDRYGVLVVNVDSNPKNSRVGGILKSFGGTDSPLVFDVTPTPGGIGPGATSMGSDRWMWRYFPDKYVSVSAADGSNLITVAGPVDKGPLLALNDPVAAGSRFIFGEVALPEGGPIQGIIASSNGIEPPTPYIIPPDSSFYDFPVFADTHVAWFRGIGVQGPNKFESIEIWASPYSENPAELVPYKLDDYVGSSMTYDIGGHGRFATASLKDPPIYAEVYVWDLVTKARVSHVLPDQRRIYGFTGLTSKHLWVLGTPQGGNFPADLVARFALD